jgi:AcrR family transcriptional regulator
MREATSRYVAPRQVTSGPGTPRPEGLRERKRRETFQRIADVGLRLFLAKGYEATTLDEIAAAAGISRRTFFYYFESKDDVLLAQLTGYEEIIKESILERSPAEAPIDVARHALLKAATRFPAPQSLAFARLMRESQALRARQHGIGFLRFEQVLYETLRELWPAKGRRDRLRLVAMAAMCAMRLASDTWIEEDGKRPLSKYIQDAFRDLKSEF